MSDERRWRVDFQYGSYISLAYEEKEKAYQLYNEQGGIRLRLCRDIFDEGDLVEGPPIIQDLSQPLSFAAAN